MTLESGPAGSTLTGVLTLARDGGGAPVRLDLRLTDAAIIDGDDEAHRAVATAQAYSRLLAQVADRIVASTPAEARGKP